MESKAFFEALQLNKHCAARLLQEEKLLEQQQRMMYNRVWRQKEILMDDYIHINVRTPSPQRSAKVSTPPPALPRGVRSSSADPLQRRGVGNHGHSARKESPLVTERPQSSELALDAAPVAGVQKESSPQDLTARKAKGAPPMFMSSGNDQTDSQHRAHGVAACQRTSSAEALSTKPSEKTDNSLSTRQFEAEELHHQNRAKVKHKHNSKTGTVQRKLPAASKDEIDFPRKGNVEKRSSSADGRNHSEVCGDQEPHKSTSRKMEPLERPLSASHIHTSSASAETSALSTRIPQTPSGQRRLSASAVPTSRRHRPEDYRTKADKWRGLGKRGNASVLGKNTRKLQVKIPDSTFLTQSQTDHESNNVEDTVTNDSNEKQDKRNDDSRATLKPRHAGKPTDHHTKDQAVFNPERDGLQDTDEEAKTAREPNPDQWTEPQLVRVERPSRHPGKNGHGRQMTLDPKLVLPLSAKRYQCQKQATIIPVITVQGRQATLFPNAEAKAGRVVTLDRRVRGWIERSTSILFSLENIQSRPPPLVPLSENPSQTSPRDEHQLISEDVASPTLKASSSPHDGVTTPHLHELVPPTSSHENRHTQLKQSVMTESSEPSPTKTIQRLRSQTFMSNAGDSDSSSDIVLVPQTIQPDPEFPLPKGKQAKEKKKDPWLKTMQRQQSMRTTPSRTPFVSFGKLQKV